MKFNLEECDDMKCWDLFVHESEQGCPYITSFWLKSFKIKKKFLMIKNKEEILAVFPLIYDKKLLKKKVFGYAGIILSRKVNNFPIHRRVKLNLDLSEFLIERTLNLKKDLTVILHPTFNDIRGFLWYNYGGGKRFKTYTHYTTLIDLQSIKENRKVEEENENYFIISKNHIQKELILNKLKMKNLFSKDLLMKLIELKKGLIFIKKEDFTFFIVLFFNEKAQVFFEETFKIDQKIISLLVNECKKNKKTIIDLGLSDDFIKEKSLIEFKLQSKPFFSAELS